MSPFHPHSPTSHEIWQLSPRLGTDLLHAPCSVCCSPSGWATAGTGHGPAEPWIPRAAPSSPDTPRWAEHRAALPGTKQLPDPSCVFLTSVAGPKHSWVTAGSPWRFPAWLIPESINHDERRTCVPQKGNGTEKLRWSFNESCQFAEIPH